MTQRLCARSSPVPAQLASSEFTLRANRILPGVREVSLAWLDANVAARTLNRPKKDIGIVEVGGASAQVAFRSTQKTGPAVSFVRVGGRRVGVVAVSILGLGSNEATDSMQEANSGGSFCFPDNAAGATPTDFLATSMTNVADPAKYPRQRHPQWRSTVRRSA